MRLSRSCEFSVEPTPPFSFQLTVRKPAGWDLFTQGEVFEDETLWTGIRYNMKPLGLKIASIGTIERPLLHVGVYSKGLLSAREGEKLRGTIAECMGAEQDLHEFYTFARKDPILRHVIDDLYGMHDTQTISLYNSVILAICLQMARLARSNQMMGAIYHRYGDTIEFDGKQVRLAPSANTVSRLDPPVFAKECNLGYRAKYLVASAKLITSGFPTMNEIMRMTPQDAREKLLELPGIGDYAADIINPHGGFPIDAWSVDVFGLLFFGKEPEDRRDAVESVKAEGMRRWGVWSWMAFFYVAQDLKNLSRRLGVELRLQ